jgi:hypothetical protein
MTLGNGKMLAMTKLLREAMTAVQTLPETWQDTVAHHLLQLVCELNDPGQQPT